MSQVHYPTTPTARSVALEVLQEVSVSDAYAALSLNKQLRTKRLIPKDRELATALVYGTLENRLRLDYVIDRFLKSPDIHPLLRDILRMSAYQLLMLDRVPAHAAVDEAVKLAKTSLPHCAGMVNAVLRNIIRTRDDIQWPAEPLEYLSVYHSMPRWLVERIVAAYGLELATEIIAYRETEHAITVRPNVMRMNADAWEMRMTQKGWQWKPGHVKEAYLVSSVGDVGLDEDYLNGSFSVQGESSILAAQAVKAANGWKVLDVCAAPGGKTAYLAEHMQGTGRIMAWDLHAHRVELIKAATQRLGLDNVRPSAKDATVFRADMEWAMDAVLIDAPCSGLGVMLDKPDIKYRQSAQSIAELVETQKKLLDVCSRYVRPGGVLIYTTCTILPEENVNQVQAFLARNPAFTLDTQPIGDYQPDATGLQLFAHREGMEGFYIARMVRGKR